MSRRLQPGEFSETWHIDWRDPIVLGRVSETKRAQRLRGKRWQALAEYGDATGKRRDLSAFGDTKGAASRALAQKIEQKKTALWVAEPLAESTTVRQLAAAWLVDRQLRVAKEEITRQTVRANQDVVDRLIVPTWGHMRAVDVTAQRLTPGLTEMAKRLDTRNVEVVLRQVFDHGCTVGLLRHNPMASITKSRSRGGAEPRALSAADLDAIEQAVILHTTSVEGQGGRRGGAYLLPLILIMIETGCRLGEALALRQSDAHLDDPTPWLRFSGTIIEPHWKGDPPIHRQPYRKGRIGSGEDRGAHDVAISVELALRIQGYATSLGDTSPSAPLLQNQQSWSWIWSATVRKALNTALSNHAPAVHTFHPHLLRSTTATLVAGMYGIEKAQELLDHASAHTTRRHYYAAQRSVVEIGGAVALYRQSQAAGITAGGSPTGAATPSHTYQDARTSADRNDHPLQHRRRNQ